MNRKTIRIVSAPIPARALIIARALFAFMVMAIPSQAHEFWLEPLEYQIQAGGEIEVQIRNGQKFSGIELAYFENRIALFDYIQNGVRTPVESRAGNTPALEMAGVADGLMTLAYQSTPSVLTYREWEKFSGFARHKGFPEAIQRHHARALPETGFKEVYTRYCKALIGIGAALGRDAATGMEAEIVALANPYVDEMGGGLRVMVLYREMARIGAQIEVFERAPDGTINISTVQTDEAGIAIIAVKPRHQYLLDSVVLREPSAAVADEHGVVWESLWASLTFGVP